MEDFIGAQVLFDFCKEANSRRPQRRWKNMMFEEEEWDWEDEEEDEEDW